MKTIQGIVVNTRIPRIPGLMLGALLVAGLVAGSPSAQAFLITNGDFETGDTTGWTIPSGHNPGSVVSGASALDGSYSFGHLATGSILAQQPAGGPLTDPGTSVSLIFSMPDPGTVGARGLNMTLYNGGSDNSQVNLRVNEDGVEDGLGDVQVYDVGIFNWQTILQDVVTFGATHALTVTFNGFGAGLDYDVSVDGNTASGLNYFQSLGGNVELNALAELRFTGAGGANNGPYTIDNVVVIPEPSSLALLLMAAGGLVWGRARRRA